MILSDKTNKFVTDTETFCNKYNLLRASDIIVGLSGGPDSTALLFVLNEICTKRNIKLHAIHINHMLRGSEADSDELLSKNISATLEIDFKAVKLDVKSYAEQEKISLETAGRKLRYKEFDLYSDEIKKNNPEAIVKIAVAHHANDLSETFLMNLFRGSGLEGLCSPQPEFKNIIRPFLFTTKEEIISFLELNSITYALDKTNEDDFCTRNGWRNKILPLISEVSIKKPTDAINDTYSLLYDDLDFITAVVNKEYANNFINLNGTHLLNLACLVSNHRSISSRMIRKLWSDTFGNLIDFEHVHLNIVLDFILEKSNQKSLTTLDLSFGRKCFIYNQMVGFADELDLKSVIEKIASLRGFIFIDEPYDVALDVNSPELPQIDVPFICQKVENSTTLEYNNLSWFLPVFDENDDLPLVVANKIKDIKFRNAGSNSEKKLSDVLCDRYIPYTLRDSVVGIKDKKGNLLWVPGVGHCKGFIDDKSRQRMNQVNSAEPIYLLKISLNDTK